MPDNVPALDEVINQGCWTPVQRAQQAEFYGKDDSHWQAVKLTQDASRFAVYCQGEFVGNVEWQLIGDHNLQNGMMAIAAAHFAGVEISQAIAGLNQFKTPKRRMELKGLVENAKVYDDFAHHPTAITSTLCGLRAAVKHERIIAVLEPRSNTMRMGVHQQALAKSLIAADDVFLYQPAGLDWNLQPVADELTAQNKNVTIHSDIDLLVADITALTKTVEATECEQSHILVMSNGGFAGIHDKLLNLN